MNTTTALRRFLRPLLAAGLLLAALFPLRVHGQYSSYSYPMYYPSGPPATMRAPSGSAGFEVPLERAGHYFSFKWRVRAADPISTGSAQTMGFVTASNVAGDTTMRSVVVTAYTPSTYSYTPFTYTYPGTNYTYTSFTYTSVPFACFDWWLVDNTANEEFYHAGTPGPAENLRNVAWRQLGSIPTRYFTIPETRFGHALVAGSPAGGWSPVTTGYYTFGTYSNGTSGTQVPLHWFTGSAPVGAGDFSIADRNDGTKAPLNQTNVSATTWVHDYSVYPLASVTFYLPAAELNNLYVLHYQIPGQVAAAMTLWPTAVSQGLNTPTVNAGTKTIPVGAATVTGAVAVGANFWLTRNLDNYSTPPFALTAALANATTLKRWWLAPPPAAVTRDAVTFGIASTRAAQTFTVSQPSSKSPTSPELGGAAARPILTYQDYAANGSANSFNYFTVTALVNRAEPFNLVTQTGSATEMFSQGQLWVLDGWIPIGGTAGTLPAGKPGQFNFALKVSGPEPATGLSLTAPDGTFYPLVPSAPTTHTFADVWHPGTNWTAVEKTWTLSLAYTGAMGGWWLANAADQDLSLSLNVGNTANYHRDLGYQATVRPLVLEVSLSRWALDTAPRLRLRQRDGSDFPVTASNTTEWSSQTPDARVWSSSAYLFHADTYARDGVDYWLYDEETGEESPYNTTDLITWFALPTPAGLTGAVNATTGAITLQWPLGFAALEGSFIVERQLSGESAWQTIETLTAEFADGNNELHFTDPAPVLGKVHSYQVRYTYGGGAAQRRSARSNRVVLTGWQDSDSDGLPDWWEVKYGLNPNNPADAGTHIIPGDMTPLEKYPKGGDPTTADTDGDGVADVNDAYLTDNRRSHILPVTRYVAVDISTPAIGTTDVWSAALDDSGQAAFAWNDAGKKEYESDVWHNGVIVQKLRLPFEYKPPSQLFIKTYPPEYNLPPAELLAVQTWWYEPKMVNASGALAGSRFAQAQIYTKAGDGADLSGLVPPDPQKPEYVIWLKTATGNDSLNWAGGARPDPVFSTHHMYYTDLHGNLGLGITNSGTLWGWNGESAYYGTFIGDTHFGVTAGIRPFDFGIYAAVQNISGNGNAVGIASIWENWASTPAAWLNTGGGFFTVFGNDSTSSSTYIGIDDSAEILGFSDRFPRAAWFPHADETVQHAFWYTDNAPTDFYSAIPEGYGSHIAFTQRPGAPLFSANGDMMFTAQIADLAANGQKIWRDGTLLWNRQKQTLSEVEIPEFATFGTKMTNDHAMVTLQWQQPQDANGHDDLTKPRYRAAMLLLPVEMVPDFNRDGVIDDKDRGKVSEQEPWRWWINDDSDNGDAEGDNKPGASPLNFSDTKINGEKDLIDWFPISLEIGNLIDVLPSASYRYELHSSDNSMNIVVPTMGTAGVKITEPNVRTYLRNRTVAETLMSPIVQVLPLTPKTILTDDFINEIKTDRSGVILVEARTETATGALSKLELHVISKTTGQDVCQVKMPMKFSGVEKMYRHLNLLAADNASGGHQTDSSDPANYPDRLCTNKNFVYLHGYNVNPEQARGWNAEMFKSLFRTGSRAKFYGVTWHGSETQIETPLGSVTPNFHLNVDNAFATASPLATALAGLQGETTVAAHSLGNMAVSSAIHDWSARITRYYMIDAAAAIESYDGGAVQEPLMVHEEWKQANRPADQNYPERVWASEWYQLSAFAAGDNRRTLTWRDRLKNTTQVAAYNFYSSGEEVLGPPDATTPGTMGAIGSQLFNIVFGTNPMGDKVWTLQEKLKGRTIVQNQIIGSQQGGWGFNPHWDIMLEPGFTRHRTPTETNSLSDAALVADPFYFFGPADLHNQNGSTYAAQHRNTLLAEMFPARTRPAGANRVESRGFVPLSGEDRNFNMNAAFQNGWPSSRNSTRWLHSDVNNVGYPYTWKLFSKFVDLGGLDQ